jgi:MFS family permease
LLVLGIVRTDQTGWGSLQTWALIIAGMILLAVFVLIEGRFARAPLMPLRIYASRTLSAANVVMLMLGGASFGMWFFVSLYLQQVLGYSPIRAGLAFLPMTICIVIGSTLASRAVTRVGAKPLLLIGMFSLTLGLLWFSRVSDTGTYVSDVLGASLLTAVGIGLAMVPTTIAAVAGVAPHEAGLASGLVNTARLFGGALGLAILAAIATSRTTSELHQAAAGGIHAALTSGFRVAFLVAAGFALVGALVALTGVPRVARRRPQAGPVAPAESA